LQSIQMVEKLLTNVDAILGQLLHIHDYTLLFWAFCQS
jgi:hypothetical protein